MNIGIYNGLALNEICVEYNTSGAPVLQETENLKKLMQEKGVSQAQISITHTNQHATAICIMQ